MAGIPFRERQIRALPPDLGPFAGALVVETKKYSLAKRDKDVLITGSARAETLRLSHTGEVMSATFNADGNCVLTASSFAAAASGEAPADSNVARLWDAETGTLLREWRFDTRQFGPLAAVFAGRRHALVLFEGNGFVLPTTLCGPEDALIQFARERVAGRETANEVERLYGHAAYDGPLRACSSRICRRYTPGDAPRYFRKKRLKYAGSRKPRP